MSFNPRTWYRDDTVARAYDAERFRSVAGRVFNCLERRALRKAFRVLSENSYVLDVPCGTGRVTELHLERGCRTLAMDISPQMQSVARERLRRFSSRLEFHVGDLADCQFSDNSFDAISCIRFLCHFDSEERVKFLQCIARITKRWAVVNVSYSSVWYRVRRKIKKVLRNDNPIRYCVSEKDLRRELSASGLDVIGRFWTLPLVSEDLILLCRKRQS